MFTATCAGLPSTSMTYVLSVSVDWYCLAEVSAQSLCYLVRTATEVSDRLRVISVRIDAALKKQITDAAANLSMTPSAWVNQALTEFFNQLGLPSRQ